MCIISLYNKGSVNSHGNHLFIFVFSRYDVLYIFGSVLQKLNSVLILITFVNISDCIHSVLYFNANAHFFSVASDIFMNSNFTSGVLDELYIYIYIIRNTFSRDEYCSRFFFKIKASFISYDAYFGHNFGQAIKFGYFCLMSVAFQLRGGMATCSH